MIWLVLWRYQLESLLESSSYGVGVFVVSFNPVDKGVDMNGVQNRVQNVVQKENYVL